MTTEVTVDEFGTAVQVGFVEVSGPSDVASLAARTTERQLGPALVAILSADLGDQFPAVLVALRPVLDEIVCCDGPDDDSGPPARGADLALLAVDDLGIGQDFVYTVPVPEAALDHALRSIAAGSSGWSGRAILVVGGAPLIQRVRRHLDRQWSASRGSTAE